MTKEMNIYRVLVENAGRPRGGGLIILNWILKE
jgi:hypothetical protein